MEASQTPIEKRGYVEICDRHLAFRAEIVRRAALIPQKDERTYFIPNTPFGIPKEPPVVFVRVVDPASWLRCMWFWDLVNFVPMPPETISIKIIQQAVGRFYGISRVDMISIRRNAKIVKARQIAMFLSKEMTKCSLPEIGRRFGGRDHTTVLHAVGKIDRLRKIDDRLAEEIRLIKVDIAA